MLPIDPRDKLVPPSDLAACWGWKKCPERTEGRLACRCAIEAQQPGRRPKFGDYPDAVPLSKEDAQKGGKKCANYGWHA